MHDIIAEQTAHFQRGHVLIADGFHDHLDAGGPGEDQASHGMRSYVEFWLGHHCHFRKADTVPMLTAPARHPLHMILTLQLWSPG